MIIRFRYKIVGAHVHCRVFTAPTMLSATFAKAGDLVFSMSEWLSVVEQLNDRVQIVQD